MSLTNYGELKSALENWSGDPDTLDSRIPEFIALCEDRMAMDLRILPMEKSADLLAYRTYTADTVAGTANAVELTLSETVTLIRGLTVSWTAASTNTSTMTLNVNSTGATALRQDDGTVAMASGDNISGLTYRAYYDGSVWRLIEPGQVPLPTRFEEAKRVRIGTSKPLDYLQPFDFLERYAGNQPGQPAAFTIEENFIRFGPVPDSDYVAKALYFRRFAALSGDTDTNWALTNARGLYLYGSMLELSNFLEDDEGVVKYGKLYEDIRGRVFLADQKKRRAGPLIQRTNVTRS